MYFKFCFVLVFFSVSAISQTQEKTDVNTDIDLVKVYTQVVKDGYGTPSVYNDLANACYFKSDYAASKKWFEKLFSEEKVTDKTLLFRYQQSLKALGIYSKENKYLAGVNLD